MLDDVKNALRVSTSDPGILQDIKDLIASARMDLIQSGVSPEIANKENEVDPLIKRAVIFYAKANFGFSNPDAERFQASYESLKQHLSYAGDYNGRME